MANVDDVVDQWLHDAHGEETAQARGDISRAEAAMPARLSDHPRGVPTPCIQRHAADSGAATR